MPDPQGSCRTMRFMGLSRSFTRRDHVSGSADSISLDPLFPAGGYPVIDDWTIRDVKLRIKGVLFSDEIPDVRDIVIISHADACGILENLLSSQELKSVAGRIEQVRKMELICRDIVEGGFPSHSRHRIVYGVEALAPPPCG